MRFNVAVSSEDSKRRIRIVGKTDDEGGYEIYAINTATGSILEEMSHRVMGYDEKEARDEMMKEIWLWSSRYHRRD